jgi:LacI family transcriptional regulator
MAKQPQVVLLIESSRGYGRGLLRGIAEYIRAHGPWSVYLQRHDLYDAVPPWLRKWRGDGIIARIENEKTARAIRDLGVPAIDLRGRLLDPAMPSILTDDEAGAGMAAQHLTKRGFQHFAYCGSVGTPYSDARSVVFERVITAAGFSCRIYQPSRPFHTGQGERMEVPGLVYEKNLVGWIRTLPKPIGVMACNDERGQQVINACRDLGIAVPDEIAVVGVDNDDVVCDLCDPPLSSVVPNTRKIGFEAAALLEQMIAGKDPPDTPIYIQPLGIVTRRSTDVLAIDDQDIAEAIRFIREHACDGITVEDVVDRLPLSHSALERQFSKLLGRTPKAEIIRVQLERVKQLLAESDLTLKQISVKAGFRHPEYMSAIFKEKVGHTPGHYRQQAQQRKVNGHALR